MKGIVVHMGANGSTEQYAKWIAEETGFDCVPARKARGLDRYDVIVLGSRVMAYKITMGKWIQKRWPRIKGKKVALFSVAGARREDPKREDWLLASVGPEIKAALPHFPLDGRMKYDSMRWIDRKMMEMGIKMTAKKDPEKAKRMAEEFDRVDRSQIRGIVEWVRG
jgi:menaquinone-dependent protoporphyrinogen IX oxidase